MVFFIKPFSEWYDDRMFRDAPVWYRKSYYAWHTLKHVPRAFRHAYHDLRGYLTYDYEAPRNVRARERADPAVALPEEITVEIVDISEDGETEYWAQTNLWVGGVSSADPLTAVQRTLHDAIDLIADGFFAMPGGKLTIRIDANPHPPESPGTVTED